MDVKLQLADLQDRVGALEAIVDILLEAMRPLGVAPPPPAKPGLRLVR